METTVNNEQGKSPSSQDLLLWVRQQVRKDGNRYLEEFVEDGRTCDCGSCHGCLYKRLERALAAEESIVATIVSLPRGWIPLEGAKRLTLASNSATKVIASQYVSLVSSLEHCEIVHGEATASASEDEPGKWDVQTRDGEDVKGLELPVAIHLITKGEKA